MSLFTQSLRELYTETPQQRDDFLNLLIAMLEHAESKHVRGSRSIENAYWQGKKDAIREALALYLNEPEIARANASSTFSDISFGE